MKLFVFDLEIYPNCFLFGGKFEGEDKIYQYEISTRINQRTEILQFLSYLQNCGAYMVGFNSLSFDYPILDKLLNNPYTFDHQTASILAQEIIGRQSYGQNPNQIRFSDRLIPQIDLVKINHFDNANRRTSLKALQFAMRSHSVEDLPFPIRDLTFTEMDILKSYHVHDITETEKFLGKCKHLINIRKELLDNGVLTGDVLNYSDVKIGVEYFVKKIGRTKCYINGSNPRQTLRTEVRLKEVTLPKITYRTETFSAVKDWFQEQIIYSGQVKTLKLKSHLGGLQFHFGLGGLHASVERKFFKSDETHVILDIDVSGMYPAVAVANNFYPEHLGSDFVVAYRQLGIDRKQYPKASAMNLVLKLANNGVFGNAGNPYSPFFDLKYLFSITINGQLQLLQLIEMLSLLPGIELIQANTDGITARIRRDSLPFFRMWTTEWEAHTGLKLEEVEYKLMWIRDVNSYIAIDTKGNIKRKGAYWYPITDSDYHGSSGTNWNKDFSNLTAQKAAEQVMINGMNLRDIIYLISDPFDFMLRYKTPGDAKLYIGDKEMSKTVRYYVSTEGEPMKKIAPPKGKVGAYKRKNKLTDAFYEKILAEIPEGTWDSRIHTKNRSTYEAVTTSVESGWLVKCCNVATDFNWKDVNYQYYIEAAEKLVISSVSV